VFWHYYAYYYVQTTPEGDGNQAVRFSWNEEQALLRATLSKYVADRHPFAKRRGRIGNGFDPAVWSELAELGLLGLPFEEEYGGSGGSPLDVLIVMEAFGRGLVVEPFIPSIILAGGLLRLMASAALRSLYIPRIISGELRCAFAFAETQSRFNLSNVATEARVQGGNYVLNGRKIVVYGAPECQMLLVVARTAGGALEKNGISVFLVPKDIRGLDLQNYRCVDGMAAADVILDHVRVPRENLLGEADHALPAIERVMDEATSAVCGEAVGAMGALVEKCVEYSKSRRAFGKPIAEFQVIGHRLVDMHVSHEVAGAMAVKTAHALQAKPHEAARMASACKVKVGREAGFVGKTAVQLHGAIGISDELDIGHYFKRLTTIQTLFGDADFHLRRFIRSSAQVA
jgi:alkylation response protein AidB-like acyl-CoA dehydrogenase